VLIQPFLLAWVNRKAITETIRRPIGIFLQNAQLSMVIDERFLRFLVCIPVEHLELMHLEIEAEKDFLERRVALVMGAIEKVGIIPGMFATLFSLSKLDQLAHHSEWIMIFAYTTPLLYIIGVIAHFLIMRLERYVRLLELVIEKNKNA
jgi:hypothetical protein